MSVASRQRFRAGLHGYVVWSVIFGGMTLAMTVSEGNRSPSFWGPAALFAGIWLFCIIWLAAFEIRITDDELIFRALFGGTKRIQHEEIQKVSLGFDPSGWGGPLRLWVQPKDSGAPKFSINAKVFSQEAVRAVLDLGERVATSDAGELEGGIVMSAVRKRRKRKSERHV